MKGEIRFSYYLQKEDSFPGEFPYQSLDRTGKIKIETDHTESDLIEIIKNYLIENADTAFAGLAFQSNYDDVIVTLQQ